MAASRTTKNYFEALAGVGSDPESAPGEREAAGGAGAAANRARCVTIPLGRKCAWPARRSSCPSAMASVFQRKPNRSLAVAAAGTQAEERQRAKRSWSGRPCGGRAAGGKTCCGAHKTRKKRRRRQEGPARPLRPPQRRRACRAVSRRGAPAATRPAPAPLQTAPRCPSPCPAPCNAAPGTHCVFIRCLLSSSCPGAKAILLRERLPAAQQRSSSAPPAAPRAPRLSGDGGKAAAPPARPQAQAGAARGADSGARAPALANPLVCLDLEMTGAWPGLA